MAIQAVRDHLFYGRPRIAAAHAQELLASDDAAAAAGVLLQVRIEQGWFRDAVQLARERFRLTLPATHLDCAALICMHTGRVWSGAEVHDPLREMEAVAAAARDRGDRRLEALAEESIARTLLLESQVAGGVNAAGAPDRYRRAIRLYREAGDQRVSLAVALHLANALLATDREAAAQLFSAVAETAAAEGLQPLVRAAQLRAHAAQVLIPGSDLESVAAESGEHDGPLGLARAFRHKTTVAFARGRYDAASANEARTMFRAEGALLDLVGFCSDVAERTFAMGDFAKAADAAREALDTCAVMPFPFGESNSRLMLASALLHLGRLVEAAAEHERIEAIPARYRRNRRLDVLPLIGFFLQVRQPERARRAALQYLSEIDASAPSPELSIALHYLANANVALRRWPDVLDALQRSAAIDEALGDAVSAAMKRIELADWSVQLHALAKAAPPADTIEAALRVYDEEEAALRAISSRDAAGMRMRLHQSRAMTFQAAQLSDRALSELTRFAKLARELGSRVHEINSRTQAGLILHDLGRRGDPGAARRAQEHLDVALTMTMAATASDAVANAAYLAAANERVLARFAASNDEAHAHLARALSLLRQADERIAQLQMQYVEPGAEAAQQARIAIHGAWKKVYDIAVELSLVDLGDAIETFVWSEKWKGRALAVSLGLRPLSHPEGVSAELLDRERLAVDKLARASSYAALVSARDRLADMWSELAALPAAAEYVALRTGRPIMFHELAALLSAEEERLNHIQSPIRK
jgi:tetratricopeptide (TPR) repeat protein